MTAALKTVPALPDVGSLESVAAGAVDLFEVAARLESTGTNDRVAARQHGAPDVFALADTLVRQAGPPASGRRAARRPGMGTALQRAVLLLAGVLLAGRTVGNLDVSTGVVWVAGAIGWVGSQAVAGVAWSRLGRGQGPAGQRVAATLSLAVLLVAAAAASRSGRPDEVLVPCVLCVGWGAYACSVSLVVSAGRTSSALVVVLTGAATATAAELLHRPWSQLAIQIATVSTVGAVVLLAGRVTVRSGGLGWPSGEDWRAAAPAAVQAATLAVAILVLMRTLPAYSSLPLVVASVVGAALADPAIVLLRGRLRTSATRMYAIEDASRRARRAALVAATSTAGLSALTALAVVLVLRVGALGWEPTVLAAASFTALSTTAAALTAFGLPWAAAAVGMLTAGYAGVVQASWELGSIVVCPVTLLLAFALLLHRVSDPRAVM